MAFYIESADRPSQSRVAAEDIHVGEAVQEDGSDGVERANANDHNDFAGVADNPQSADWIAAEADEDSNETYDSADNDRVVYGGGAPGDVIKVRTIENNSTDPAPSINDGDTVIIPDASLADSATEFEGRVVQSGYSDDSGDTHNTSNGIVVGKAYRDSATSFDSVVRVKVSRDRDVAK